MTVLQHTGAAESHVNKRWRQYEEICCLLPWADFYKQSSGMAKI